MLLAIETTGKSGSVALLDNQGPAENGLIGTNGSAGSPVSRKDLAAAPESDSPAWRARNSRPSTKVAASTVAASILEFCLLPESPRAAVTLVPQIQWLAKVAMDYGRPINQISVAAGPGSFTGLRIGVTTAKTLSFAWKIPLAAVDSLAAIAAEAFRVQPEAQKMMVAIDAYRGQVYQATFSRTDDLDFSGAKNAGESLSSGVQLRTDFVTELSQLSSDFWFAGDPKLFSSTDAQIPDTRWIDRQCDAIGVGLLGHVAGSHEAWIDPMTLVPRYLKPSAAEEKVSPTTI